MSVLLEMQKIKKSFGGIEALKGVDIKIEKGKIHALLGKNGAGKSTLVKILVGVVSPDSGSIILQGTPVKITNPQEALKNGISIVYQELSLVPDLSVAENIYLGRLPKSGIRVNWKKLFQDSENILNKLNCKINPKTKIAQLSIAQQQLVEIAKAISFSPKILILDEPTSALMDEEIKQLFVTINLLKENGVGIIYISHRLAEVQQIADHITILRDGEKISEGDINTFNKEDIIKGIIGNRLLKFKYQLAEPSQEVILSVKGLTKKGVYNDISFDLHKGEIIGIAGLMGAKRTELLRSIFGLDTITEGQIIFKGQNIKKPTPGLMKRLGFALTPEDRKTQGIFIDFSVKQNISITNLSRISKFKVVNRKKERRMAERQIEKYDILTSGPEAITSSLSGGNQQKVALAKWLVNEPQVLILDEPTRGIDVGAKAQIFELLENYAKNGGAVIFVSSELEEVLEMSHKIIVLYNGKMVGEYSRNESKAYEEILLAATGQI